MHVLPVLQVLLYLNKRQLLFKNLLLYRDLDFTFWAVRLKKIAERGVSKLKFINRYY
jgi:hypothetical protein